MMNSKKLSNKRQYLYLAAGLLTAGVAVIIMCVGLVSKLTSITRFETDRYLKELSESISLTIDSRMDAMFQILESVGETYLAMPENAKRVMGCHISQQSKTHVFSMMSIILADGRIIYSDDHTEHTLAGLPCISKAMEGKKEVTRIYRSGQEEGIVYACPIYSDDTVIGVVAAWGELNSFQRLMKIDSFGGEGFSLIIDTDGYVVVGTDNKNAQVDVFNFFTIIEKRGLIEGGNSLEEMKNAMLGGKSGKMNYKLDDGITKNMHFVPLIYDNLYLLSVVPAEAASHPMETLVQQSFYVVYTIIAMFIALIILTLVVSLNARNKISRLAFRDPVTGGYSQLRFDMEAEEILKSASAGTYKFVALNIQKFKLINENFGIETGNLFLKHVYESITGLLENGEIMTRVTADDFYILSKAKTREKDECEFCKYSEIINTFQNLEMNKYVINITIGVFLINDPSLSLVHIRDRANIARKKAKPVYGNMLSYIFYNDLERLQMLKEKDMENRMEDALTNNEFTVYLQPKIELLHNKVIGAESLVRWKSREKGLISPGDFIPFFEKNGFIIKLDLYVFDKTCEVIRKWLDSGFKPIPVSVNMSRMHLQDPDFLNKYKVIAKHYNIPDQILEIELTESIVFENLDTLAEVINQIHNAGFLCALDDFGSGYSSLNTLKDIKVDSLKIDGAFWKTRSGQEQRARDIIETVVELGKKLNMTTVSEGVETVEQVDFLRKIKCDSVQGYVFSKPIPPADFELLTFGKSVTV